MAQLQLQAPSDLLQYQLRTAVTMENDSLAMLKELGTAARSAEVKKMFTHHAQETKEQIANLTKVFKLLELKQTTAASPTTKGLARQGEALIKRSDPKLRDTVVLSAALGTEHYEMAAYQALLVPVEAMGASDVAALLRSNLDQETHTSEELQKMLMKVAGMPA